MFHRRAARPGTPFCEDLLFPLTSSRLRLVRAQPPATVCGFPFGVNYFTYASLLFTSSLAAGWVSPAATSGTSDGYNL